MSGIDSAQKDTWKFMIDELLSEFNHPETGYIALNKPALNYVSSLNEENNSVDEEIAVPSAAEIETLRLESNSSGFMSYFWKTPEPTNTSTNQSESILSSVVWATRSFFGDTIDLTVDKLSALTEFVAQVTRDREVPMKIQRLFLNLDSDTQESEPIKVIKRQELSEIEARILVLKNYGVVAKERIKSNLDQRNIDLAFQHKPTITPATADEHLAIWDKMWSWIESEKNLLHICLSFEAPQSVERATDLAVRYDSLEKELVTFQFRNMFLIKLDEIRHEQSNHFNYAQILRMQPIKYNRMLPNLEAVELAKILHEDLIILNNNMNNDAKPLLRIEPLVKIIESVQKIVDTAFINTRGWLKNNLFLTQMNIDLTSIHKKANKLHSDIKIHLTMKESGRALECLKVKA